MMYGLANHAEDFALRNTIIIYGTPEMSRSAGF